MIRAGHPLNSASSNLIRSAGLSATNSRMSPTERKCERALSVPAWSPED